MKKVLFGLMAIGFLVLVGKVYAADDSAMKMDPDMKMDAVKQEAAPVADKAVNVGNKICPVSGEKIGEMGPAVTYEYKGKIYNFCCKACPEEFKKDPEKYIKKVNEELKARQDK